MVIPVNKQEEANTSQSIRAVPSSMTAAAGTAILDSTLESSVKSMSLLHPSHTANKEVGHPEQDSEHPTSLKNTTSSIPNVTSSPPPGSPSVNNNNNNESLPTPAPPTIHFNLPAETDAVQNLRVDVKSIPDTQPLSSQSPEHHGNHILNSASVETPDSFQDSLDGSTNAMRKTHAKRNQSGSASSGSPLKGGSSSKSKSGGIMDDESSAGSALDMVDENASIASAAAEARHSSSSKAPKRQKSDKEVLVGTPVKEGHVNYMLMYDMLTGIRISVSRCNSKPPRDVEPSDFLQAHKLAFDETGKELTPKSEYDFKFKDYAPWVFKNIRDIFNVDPAEYLLSLTGKYVLSELGSPGKSGSFFYFSSDYRFIIKTIHHSEHKFMRKILLHYYNHVKDNPHTLLSRILGLHRVKLPGNKKIHFVVMGNVFPPNKDIHEVYDLKGSTVGRSISEDEIKNNPRAVMKDLNWLARGKKIRLGPAKKIPFCEQMERDVAYLKEQNIMDYSLLIGIHDMIKGNKEHLREKSLSVFEPSILDQLPKTPTKKKTRRRLRTASDPISLTPSASKLPEYTPEERRHVIFYQDAGGFQATDENDQPLPIIYYLGIIDIFTNYSATKKLEHMFRSMAHNSKKISAVHPKQYGTRFLEFMKKAIQMSS